MILTATGAAVSLSQQSAHCRNGDNAGNSYQFFLSHAWDLDALGRDNHKRALSLMKELSDMKTVSWIDDENLPDQPKIRQSIISGIDDSEYFVVCLTEKYIEKVKDLRKHSWCRDELEHALLTKPDKIFVIAMEKRIFEMLSDDGHGSELSKGGNHISQLPGFLFIDFTEDSNLFSAASALICRALKESAHVNEIDKNLTEVKFAAAKKNFTSWLAFYGGPTVEEAAFTLEQFANSRHKYSFEAAMILFKSQNYYKKGVPALQRLVCADSNVNDEKSFEAALALARSILYRNEGIPFLRRVFECRARHAKKTEAALALFEALDGESTQLSQYLSDVFRTLSDDSQLKFDIGRALWRNEYKPTVVADYFSEAQLRQSHPFHANAIKFMQKQ
jgi:hypothetical protein